MKRVVVLLFALFVACRGEPVPRDYQNSPPAATHPPANATETPAAQGMPGPKPEPSTGAEGKSVKPVEPVPATNTLKDQAPVTPTQTST